MITPFIVAEDSEGNQVYVESVDNQDRVMYQAADGSEAEVIYESGGSIELSPELQVNGYVLFKDESYYADAISPRLFG